MLTHFYSYLDKNKQKTGGMSSVWQRHHTNVNMSFHILNNISSHLFVWCKTIGSGLLKCTTQGISVCQHKCLHVGYIISSLGALTRYRINCVKKRYVRSVRVPI